MIALVLLCLILSIYFFKFRLLKFFLTIEVSLVLLFLVMGLSLFKFSLVVLLFFISLFSSEASLSFSVLIGFLKKESFGYVSSNSFGFF